MTSRRDVLSVGLGLSGLALTGGAASAHGPSGGPPALPDKSDFNLHGIAYLDAANEHPLSHAGRQALDAYYDSRSRSMADLPDRSVAVREKFARLINASVDEIAYAESTTAAEQMIVRALGLPAPGARIVTDTLHFFGSFPIYTELEKRGCEVVWLRPKDGRIDPDDIERAVTPGTRLVSVSAVSTFNGFQHDLKRVCEIAHAAGALVYADIIHAVGCLPLDVRDSGVDFAACSTYKWLMADYGLAFLYARKDRLAQLKRLQFGYNASLANVQYHAYPLDPPGGPVEAYDYRETAVGYFSAGHINSANVALLDRSLDDVQALGPAQINAHVQPMLRRLKQELPRLGYTVATPPEATSPMVTCVLRDAGRLQPRLQRAGVRISTVRNRFRASLSVFNDMDDVERFLSALGPASAQG